MRLFPTFLLISKSKTLGNGIESSQSAAWPTSARHSAFLARNSLICLEAVHGRKLGISQRLARRVKRSQPCSLTARERGLETRFHRSPAGNRCAHPDGRLHHRTQGSGCHDVLVPFTALNAARLRQSSRGPGAAARSRQAPTPSPGPSPPPASADLVNQACPQGTGPRARRGEQEGNPLVRVPRRFSAPPIIWHAESLRPVIQLSTAL